MKKLILFLLIFMFSSHLIYADISGGCDTSSFDGCNDNDKKELIINDPSLIASNPEFADLLDESDFQSNPDVLEAVLIDRPDYLSRFSDNGVNLLNGNENAMSLFLAEKGDVILYSGVQLQSISDDGTIVTSGDASTTFNLEEFKGSSKQVIINSDGSLSINGGLISSGSVYYSSEAGVDPIIQVTGENSKVDLTQLSLGSSELKIQILDGGIIETSMGIISGPKEGFQITLNPEGSFILESSESGKYVEITNSDERFRIEGKATFNLCSDCFNIDLSEGSKFVSYLSEDSGSDTEWKRDFTIVADEALKLNLDDSRSTCVNNCISLSTQGEVRILDVKNVAAKLAFSQLPEKISIDGSELDDEQRIIIGEGEDSLKEYLYVTNNEVSKTPNFNFEDVINFEAKILDSDNTVKIIDVKTLSSSVSEVKQIEAVWACSLLEEGEACRLGERNIPYEVKLIDGKRFYCSNDGECFSNTGGRLFNGQWVDANRNVCSDSTQPCSFSVNVDYFDGNSKGEYVFPGKQWIYADTKIGDVVIINGARYTGEECPQNPSQICFRYDSDEIYTAQGQCANNDDANCKSQNAPYFSGGEKAQEEYKEANLGEVRTDDGVKIFDEINLDGSAKLVNLLSFDNSATILEDCILNSNSCKVGQYTYLPFLSGDDIYYRASDGEIFNSDGVLIDDKGNFIDRAGKTCDTPCAFSSQKDSFESKSSVSFEMSEDILIGSVIGEKLTYNIPSGYCARYVSTAARDKFSLDYVNRDAWEYGGANQVIGTFPNLDGSSSTDQQTYAEQIRTAYSNGEIKPGMIISMWYPRSKYNHLDVTHVVMVVGSDSNGDVIVDHQFGPTVYRETIPNLMARTKVEPREVITPRNSYLIS